MGLPIDDSFWKLSKRWVGGNGKRAPPLAPPPISRTPGRPPRPVAGGEAGAAAPTSFVTGDLPLADSRRQTVRRYAHRGGSPDLVLKDLRAAVRAGGRPPAVLQQLRRHRRIVEGALATLRQLQPPGR